MKFECPHCHQHLESGASMAGSSIQCPACNGDILVPPAPGEESRNTPAQAAAPGTLPHTLQSSIDRGGRSLHQVMAEKQIEGGVELAEDAMPPSGDDVAGAVTQALPGAESANRYQIGDLVAQGGMGAILTARDVNLRRSVAMKVMLDPAHARQQDVLRFIEEAQVTSQLEHPGVVPVHELGAGGDGQVFYTMKFVKGQTLRDILKGIADGDPGMVENYPLSRLLTIYQKVCDALAFAHSKRVVHRDLKPENIMVGDYGEVLVMDWGLAKVLPKKVVRKVRFKGSAVAQGAMADKSAVHGLQAAQTPAPTPDAVVESVRQDEGGDVLKTMSGQIMGTPGFMAPEQAEGRIEQIDERADVYALGAILYQVLTLRPPVQGKDLMEILQKITTGQIPHPSTYNPKSTKRRRGDQGESAFGSVPAPTERREGEIELAHLPGQRVPDSPSAVAMKALKTDAAERYQTVPELQKDIEAFQTGFATGAEKAGAWKQFALFVRRNKAVSVATLIALLLLGGSITIGYTKNRQQRLRAETALANYEASQAARAQDRKASAPALVDAARVLAEKKQFTSALGSIDSAIEYDPALAEARLIRALLLIQTREYARAAEEAAAYQRLCPDDRTGKVVAEVARHGSTQGLASGSEAELSAAASKLGMPLMAAEFSRRLEDQLPPLREKIEKTWPGNGLRLSISPDRVLELNFFRKKDLVDLSPLTGIPLQSLDISASPVRDLTPLKGMPLTTLRMASTQVADLSPLKGMSLRSLVASYTPVSDLTPLKDMPITFLELRATRVADLGPLAGMPLTKLFISETKVASLTPLKGMPLRTLGLAHEQSYPCPVTDLTPLDGMALTELHLVPSTITKGLDVLRRMTSLANINGQPAAEFWKKYDAGEFKGK